MKLRWPLQTRPVQIRMRLILLGLLCTCLPVYAATSSGTQETRPAAPRTSAMELPETSGTSATRDATPSTTTATSTGDTAAAGSQALPGATTTSPLISTSASGTAPALSHSPPTTPSPRLPEAQAESRVEAEPETPAESRRAPEPARPAKQSLKPSSVNLLSATPVQLMPADQVPLVLYHEWLVSSVSMEAAQQAQRLLAPYGLKIKRRQHLSELGFIISVYRLPEHIDARALFDQIRNQFPDLNIEFNQRYPLLSSTQGKPVNIKQYGQHLTGIPREGCPAVNVNIAMMDSKVNADLPEFKGFKLKTLDIALLKKEAVSDHGTAVADLFRQLVPKASLLAINVYQQNGETIETHSDWLLSGFELVLSDASKPRVLNMSFGGNPSALLKRALDKLQEQQIRLVAAAGNSGPQASAVYPAAYPNVLAVSAVDIKERLWSQSNRGDYLQFSAPGVDLWLMGAQGKKRYMSGTSFAAPWVSALAAIAPEAQWQQPESLVKDLGQTGFDAHFGYGLVQFTRFCTE